MNPTRRRAAQAIAAFVLCAATAFACAELPQIPLAIGTHKLTAEVAATDKHRATGLMHRRMLPENRGMLFVFPDAAYHSMWMMNTYIPLSVAFIDREGVIINIEDMTPHTQNPHGAQRPAKYALEMNQGWFTKRGIKAGTRVQGLDAAGPGR